LLGQSNYEKKQKKSNSLSPSPAASKSTRESKESPKRQKKVVAAHHYHPEVIQLLVTVDSKIQFFDHLTDSFVRDSGLWNNGYTESDNFPGEFILDKKTVKERVFVPVPSYKNAMNDYRLVVTRCRMNDIVRTCKDTQHDGEDDVLRPVM